MSRFGHAAAVVLCLIIGGHCPSATAQSRPDVKLVLQLTIDGLRGDLLNRYGRNFGNGGFRYLMDKGVVYANAHYQHANTETIVGHTTLATGANPAQHGMVGNLWLDRDAGELTYNIEDPASPLLASRETAETSAQLDPTQKAARTQGRSPRAILTPTLSDGLAAFYGGRSKIFAVAGKDRGAVSMAGHAGKAFWFSSDSGDFVTSTYYYDTYPEWAQTWNAKRLAEGQAGKSWELLHEKARYLLGHQDDRPYETDLRGYGRTFPHPFGPADDKLFLTRIFVSPVIDQLTLDFAKALLDNERLGQDAIPDYLAISFSAVDAVNHFFGPSSLENEDMALQLDRTLADLFAFIDNSVGLDKTLVILSADHGMAEMPEYMSGLGYPAARLSSEAVTDIANAVGERSFGIDGLVKRFFRPYMYLDDNKIKATDLDRTEVKLAVAAALSQADGIALAVPQGGPVQTQTSAVYERVQRNYHRGRSGDIYVVQQPYWFLFEKGPIAVMHGSPWRYDTHVPIIFAGAGIESQTVQRLVHPVDVAPTIAAFLGMSPPSSSQGSPLAEILP